MTMTIFIRTLAWCLAAAVAFATLGPPYYRPHTDLGQNAEHAIAFILIGLAFGLAYTRTRLLTTLVAVVMTGVIELLQFWAPGRHARLMDRGRCSGGLCGACRRGGARLGDQAIAFA